MRTSAYMHWCLIHIWPTTACLSQLWRADETLGMLMVDVSIVPRTKTVHGTRA